MTCSVVSTLSKPILVVLTIVLIALLVMVIHRSSCSASSSESYVVYDREGSYAEKCPLHYRAVFDHNRDASNAGERCRLCHVDMAASQRERLPSVSGCSHGSRQYGVSLCNQAAMMTQSHA